MAHIKIFNISKTESCVRKDVPWSGVQRQTCSQRTVSSEDTDIGEAGFYYKTHSPSSQTNTQ